MRTNAIARIAHTKGLLAVGSMLAFLIVFADPRFAYLGFVLQVLRDPLHTARAAQIFSPGVAYGALPGKTVEALFFLSKQGAEDFDLSPKMEEDVLNRQRLTEAAFPLRRVVGSRWRVFERGETLSASCRSLSNGKGVVLAFCN